MNDQELTEKEISEPIGRLTGKTTVHSVTMLIKDPKVGKKNYFVLYGHKDEEGRREHYILTVEDIWNNSEGIKANVKIIGNRPNRPFDVGADVYLATEEQIKEILGINNPPNQSVSLGTLLGYNFNVNLLVKKIGRVFITGKSGSGKSYTMGVLCEEFLQKGIPVVILDRHGEYGSLKVASDELKSLEKEDEGEIIGKGKEGKDEAANAGLCPWCGSFIPLDTKTCEFCGKELIAEFEKPSEEGEEPETLQEKSPEKKESKSKKEVLESPYVNNIIEFADLKKNPGGDIDLEYLFSLDVKDIVAPRSCTIVNLRGLDLEVQEQIAGKLLKKLYKASTERKIPPFYLFLDEAHLFAGKKTSETSEIVKLFAQEGRKFGANIIIGTQRPQLLDTTIRVQAGTWIVHNLSDVRDIDITISSAEDLSKEHKNEISGLDKGQAIISGEAVSGIPLYVQVRRRKTIHGGSGFNPLDFLSEETIEELQKRKERILTNKSSEELQVGRTMFEEMQKPRTAEEYLEEIAQLKIKVKELEEENEMLKARCNELEQKTPIKAISQGSESEQIKELQTQIKVWQGRYNHLKKSMETSEPSTFTENKDQLRELNNKIIELQAELKKYKEKYTDALLLAEKSIAELKKLKR
ncbi:MAG: helicase HerA domain-containing protein [Promethearchaeota archaeon]